MKHTPQGLDKASISSHMTTSHPWSCRPCPLRNRTRPA